MGEREIVREELQREGRQERIMSDRPDFHWEYETQPGNKDFQPYTAQVSDYIESHIKGTAAPCLIDTGNDRIFKVEFDRSITNQASGNNLGQITGGRQISVKWTG